MLTAALRKELLQMVAVFVFGASSLLLFSFAVGPVAEALRQFSAGFLWLALLLSSTLTLSESFHTEMEHRAFEGLLLLPADARNLYYGKALANWLRLFVLGILLVPVMVVLYDAGTLYAAMTAQLPATQTLLPLLLFPLIVPVLLASVKATSLLLLGDPMGQARSWITSPATLHWLSLTP